MQLLNRFHRIGELFLLCALWPWLSFANSPGVDDHTVALWLFDEPTYPNVILTDAGPRGYDLRLQSSYAAWSLKTEGKGAPPIAPLHLAGKYGLIPGKFGNALYNPKSADAQVIWPDNRQRYSSTSMLGYVDKVPERLNLGYYDWTIEFWFKARGPQTEAATLFRVRNEQDYPRGLPMENALRLMPGRSAFLLQSRTTTDSQRDVVGDPGTHFSFDIPIPTDTRLLNDGDWHHIAFCYQADRRQILHYVDGRQQPLPETGGFLPMIGVLTEFTVSENCEGMLDEYRVSDNVRYPGNFTPPESFSRNYGTAPKTSPEPEGPPLLFANNRDPSQPYDLGSRKHVLIDGALVESLDKLEFRPQSPQIWQETDFRNSEPWEATPRFGSTIPDVSTIWDEGNELHMLYTNGGMWGGKKHVICLATSRDGLHWEKPELKLHAWEGEFPTNILIPNAGQGALIKEVRHGVPDGERYKLLQWSLYRGYYLYTSPDGIHFQRNETVGLPFDTDGSTTFFWDDQRGFYHAYFRVVSEDRAIRRRAGHQKIHDLFKPWPFKPVDQPWTDDLVLTVPARGELPVIDTGGQVYRFKAHKYAWAPDTYLAFPWRYAGDTNVRPGSFLMVSRDGDNWTRYEDPYYFPGGWTMNNREVIEALTEHGLIRRGDKLWQYGTVRFTEHGGALYGGVEHEGGMHDRLLRLEQRLDGFVALQPKNREEDGAMVTKLLTFSGKNLELNVDASDGEVLVELQDAQGQPINGFTFADFVPLTRDGTAQVARWRNKSSLADLASQPVRVKFKLTQARLFAFQFKP